MGLAGIITLAATVNVLTALLGFVTILWYLGLYTPAKRFTTLNTVIGAVPGAIPPLMGFTAAQGALSPEALSIFAILFFWQMPHFLAIAIMYRDDYSLAGFKMLPCVDRELSVTSRMIVLYAIVLIPVSLLPALLGAAGNAYACTALLLGLAFLSFAITCATTRTRIDARKLFFSSIVYLPMLLAALLLDKTG
jgi:protoheme IX farnesyltransferase